MVVLALTYHPSRLVSEPKLHCVCACVAQQVKLLLLCYEPDCVAHVEGVDYPWLDGEVVHPVGPYVLRIVPYPDISSPCVPDQELTCAPEPDVGYEWLAKGSILVIKTDEEGNLVWEKKFEGEGAADGASVRQTDDGGYIVCGTTKADSYTLSQILVLKLSP